MKKKKKELLDYFLKDNKSGYKTKEKHIIKHFNGLIDDINNYHINSKFIGEVSFTQKLYNYLYEISEAPPCETCGVEIKWRNRFTEGYPLNCSKQCRGTSQKRLQKIKNTTLKRYGVESISQVDKFKSKRKNTYFKKYGTYNIFDSELVKEKTKKTNIKKYGTEFPSQSIEVKETTRNNNIEKYGVTNPSKLDSVKNKLIKTNLDRYGVHTVMRVENYVKKNVKSRTKKTIERYKNELGNDVEFEYQRQSLKVKNQCNLHPEYIINNTLFYYRVLVLKIQNPCIKCNPINYNESIKETELNEFISSLGFKTVRKRIDEKEIDVYVEEKNVGFEFDGIYWHSELFLDSQYHANKTDYMSTKGIQLYHIFEDEWTYKNEITKSLIKAKLGIFNTKIYGRKCKISTISTQESELFLNENHIQGNTNCSIKIGLFYENELVSVMTFSKEKRKKIKNKNKNEYELVRFCNKLNTTVIGGASKLFKYFINNYKPAMISTFADRRYSIGDLYQKLGFTFKYSIDPNYWYFNTKDKIRLHRFNFRKKILIKDGYDMNKTEHEIMLERGYLRIYDCGNLKYEYVVS